MYSPRFIHLPVFFHHLQAIRRFTSSRDFLTVRPKCFHVVAEYSKHRTNCTRTRSTFQLANILGPYTHFHNFQRIADVKSPQISSRSSLAFPFACFHRSRAISWRGGIGTSITESFFPPCGYMCILGPALNTQTTREISSNPTAKIITRSIVEMLKLNKDKAFPRNTVRTTVNAQALIAGPRTTPGRLGS
jgi:hypothetical protein